MMTAHKQELKLKKHDLIDELAELDSINNENNKEEPLIVPNCSIDFKDKTVEEIVKEMDLYRREEMNPLRATIYKSDEEFFHYKVYKFKANKYIAEVEEHVLWIIDQYRQTFIKCPAGGGKTTFIFKNLFPVVKRNNQTLILVLPNVENLLNLYPRYKNSHKIKVLKEGEVFKEGFDIYISTPDSLDKIPNSIMKNAYLVVDEYHTCIVEKGFRSRAYDNLRRAEEVAYKTVAMTATPHMFDLEEFEAAIDLTIVNNIKCKNLKVLVIDKITDSSLPNLIKEKAQLHDMLLVINDDIKQNKLIKEVLEAQGLDGIVTYSSNNREGEHMNYLREHGYFPDWVKIIISTSAINSGIDINNECNFASMTIWQKKYSLAKDEQAKARNRRGSHTLYTVLRGTQDALTKETFAKKFSYYESQTLESMKDLSLALNKCQIHSDEPFRNPSDMLIYNEETGLFEVDHLQVKKNALALYDQDLALNTKSLVKEILENGTFTIENNNIEDCIEFIQAVEDEELNKQLKEERKADREMNQMKELATKELLVKLKQIVDSSLDMLKKESPNMDEEKLKRKAYKPYQALFEENAREYLEKEANVFALETCTEEEIAIVERIQEVGEEQLSDIKKLAIGNDRVCTTYAEAVALVAQAIVDDIEYSKNRVAELKEQKKVLDAKLKVKQIEIEEKINELEVSYRTKKEEISSKYVGKLTDSKKAKKKDELKQLKVNHNANVKALEKKFASYKKELGIPKVKERTRNISELITEIKFKALAPTLIKTAINEYKNVDVFKLKKDLKGIEKKKEIRKMMLKTKKVEEVAIYLKHLEVRKRITKEKLTNLYLDLADIGFIDDTDFRKQIAGQLSTNEKVDAKKIVIPTTLTEELLRKINIIFKISDINKISSLNI